MKTPQAPLGVVSAALRLAHRTDDSRRFRGGDLSFGKHPKLSMIVLDILRSSFLVTITCRSYGPEGISCLSACAWRRFLRVYQDR